MSHLTYTATNRNQVKPIYHNTGRFRGYNPTCILLKRANTGTINGTRNHKSMSLAGFPQPPYNI